MNGASAVDQNIVWEGLRRVVLRDHGGLLVQQHRKAISASLDQRLYLARGARVVCTDGDHFKSLFLELPIHLVQMGHFELARSAPGRPKVQEHHLAFEAREAHLLAIDVSQCEIRSGFASNGNPSRQKDPNRDGLDDPNEELNHGFSRECQDDS